MTTESCEDEASLSPTQSLDDSGDQHSGDMTESAEQERKSTTQFQAGSSQSKAANAKDPLRPRRKKARRACYACQRAHLTCGDERPCQRCIKRGLQDACHDGVRKKAKYLHDAPNEALVPGMGPRGVEVNQFQYVPDLGQGQQLPSTPGYPGASVTYASQQSPPAAFPRYSLSGPQLQMPPPFTEGMMTSQSYTTQASPVSPQFSTGPNSQASPMQSIGSALQHSQQATSAVQGSFPGPMFDPREALQYNFDPASFNFGNHYGALEFGILAHMSSGAGETPPSDSTTANVGRNQTGSYHTPSTLSASYSETSSTAPPYLYQQDQGLGEWRGDLSSNIRPGSGPAIYNFNQVQDPSEHIKQEEPHAFAIGASSAFTTPETSSSSQGMLTSFDEASSATAAYATSALRQGAQGRLPLKQDSQPTISTPSLQASSLPPRRIRDSSTIYDSVKQPYSYTDGFHKMTAFVQRRFSPQRTLRIAQALARIRPSFISCTRNLSQEDLLFMEKCFQRTLWEYEDFINACGTPTIVCRRTGEVAAVGKEFSILTGWSKEVLLGKAPNLNVNTGGNSSQPGTGASSRGGYNTPRVSDDSRSQPVFLAELLDDESAIEFYEDFARLAFGDSRGSVTTHCKLLTYKTMDDPSFAPNRESGFDDEFDSRLKKKRRMYGPGGGGSSEAKIQGFGDRDGKVECSYCWTVKRDVFDIPMLIVMNFLPCI